MHYDIEEDFDLEDVDFRCEVPGSLLSAYDHIANGWFEPHYTPNTFRVVDLSRAKELYPEAFDFCEDCGKTIFLKNISGIDALQNTPEYFYEKLSNVALYEHKECFLNNVQEMLFVKGANSPDSYWYIPKNTKECCYYSVDVGSNQLIRRTEDEVNAKRENSERAKD